MYVSFELSMLDNNSWDGKWTGDGKLYARVMNVGTSKAARAKWEKLIGQHSFSFRDGWRAQITVRECTGAAARKLRKDSLGFCGYDWMIASLRLWGRILLGRGNPLGASPQMALDAVPAPVSPGPGRNAQPTHGKRALGSCVTARRDGTNCEPSCLGRVKEQRGGPSRYEGHFTIRGKVSRHDR